MTSVATYFNITHVCYAKRRNEKTRSFVCEINRTQPTQIEIKSQRQISHTVLHGGLRLLREWSRFQATAIHDGAILARWVASPLAYNRSGSDGFAISAGTVDALYAYHRPCH